MQSIDYKWIECKCCNLCGLQAHLTKCDVRSDLGLFLFYRIDENCFAFFGNSISIVICRLENWGLDRFCEWEGDKVPTIGRANIRVLVDESMGVG